MVGAHCGEPALQLHAGRRSATHPTRFGFSEELRGRPNLMVGAHSEETAWQMHAGRRSATHPKCLVGIFEELKTGSAPIGGCVNSRRYGRCRTCAANRRLRHAGQGEAVESPDGLGDES